MTMVEFDKILDEFKEADTEQKINIYVTAEGLSQDQYKELLRAFPLQELHRLEEAMNWEE